MFQVVCKIQRGFLKPLETPLGTPLLPKHRTFPDPWDRSRCLISLIDKARAESCLMLKQVVRAYIRPLQINSLFPVHGPHLVTVSSKYSIIPYSSIIFQLFLHTEWLSKSHLEAVSVHVSVVLSSWHKLYVCTIFAT